ncbi:PQ-loop domain-containing transporter [Mycoplasmopsis felifaucium]|uniref:PQ-loop domain-containing transporter n=2 Tax=Mycoplasmopsis felifaucium TaxID=35768 RepID=A0ABZ2RPS4_9BACT
MMNKIFNSFYINSNHPVSGWFIIICGFLGACMTIIIGLPQAIHLFKTKKAGLVKYYSFWIFFIGILGWIAIGAFDPTQKIFILVIANILCGSIYIFVLWLIYRYSSDANRRNKQWIVLAVASVSMILITIAAIIGLAKPELKTPSLLQTIFGQIIPILTTFAFLPQVLKSIESKDFSGMSLGMVIVFVVANVFWCGYWMSFIFNNGTQPQYLSAITWQVISLLLYVLVLVLMLLNKNKTTVLKVNQEQEPFVELNGR